MLFLPGVGAYKTGINSLKDKGLYDVLREVVQIKTYIFLFLCAQLGHAEEGISIFGVESFLFSRLRHLRASRI